MDLTIFQISTVVFLRSRGSVLFRIEGSSLSNWRPCIYLLNHYTYIINSYRNVTDCLDCTPGWFCDGSGLPVPRDLCAPGYYCTGGAREATQHKCPRGYKCPEGSPNPVPCDAGHYQNETIQATCRICPPGFYCNDTYGPVISYGQFLCIEGHYCPEGTKYAEEFKCPPGTFNNRTGMDDKSDCRTCTGGMVCDEWGLVTPYKLCGAGYFCREGANSTTPNLGEKADICPAGFYCPQGTGIVLWRFSN